MKDVKQQSRWVNHVAFHTKPSLHGEVHLDIKNHLASNEVMIASQWGWPHWTQGI